MQRRILIGDDSPQVRQSLRQFLEKQSGWKVVGEATNGREAIKKAQELKPDLVVLDLAMSEMNGIRAARELKRILPALPVIMFTNVESDRLSQIALVSGVDAVVPKSAPGTLVERMQALLET